MKRFVVLVALSWNVDGEERKWKKSVDDASCFCDDAAEFCGSAALWDHTCAEEPCAADDDGSRTRNAYVRGVCCGGCADAPPVFDDDGGAVQGGTSGKWILVNVCIVVALAAAWACAYCAGFDGPVRDDGVAVGLGAAARAALGGRQGRRALAFEAVGLALFVVFGETDRRARVQIAAAVAHLASFVLYAIYPGSARLECRTTGRLGTAGSAWLCCGWASMCTLCGLLFHSRWMLYFFCCLPCFGCIKAARVLAFGAPVKRRAPRVAPANEGPVTATRIPLAVAAWLPAVTVEYAYADEEPAVGVVVTAQPAGAATARDRGALPRATEL